MKSLFAALLALVAGLFSTACDRQGRFIEEVGLDRLEPGVSTEADVRNVMGQPDAVLDDDDGGKTLQYPRGPEGPRTWAFTVGPDGVLRGYRQLLTPENFARVQQGMDRNEIRRMFGRPRSVVTYALKNEEVWDWKYLHHNNLQLFNIHFDASSGQVTATSTSSLMPDLPKH